MKLRLYHYWRSSSSWRVRWAFAIKGVQAEMIAVNLLTEENETADHRARNPLGYVPALELIEGSRTRWLAESMAIIEWADETYAGNSLLPGDSYQRARMRQLAEIINSGTQPLQNLGVTELHSSDPAEKKRWNQHWIRQGLGAYEALVGETAGQFSFGDTVTLADLFLIPQAYNAARNEVSLEDFPKIGRINANALALQSCQASHPDRFQPNSAVK